MTTKEELAETIANPIINELKEEIEEKKKEIEELEDWEMEEEDYDELLDDIYPECKVGWFTVNTSYAVKTIDRVAYDLGLGEEEDKVREEKREYLESELMELESELEDLING